MITDYILLIMILGSKDNRFNNKQEQSIKSRKIFHMVSDIQITDCKLKHMLSKECKCQELKT